MTLAVFERLARSAVGFVLLAGLSLSARAHIPPAPPFQATRAVTIASEGARPPFNYLDQSGELAGFEIDLAREICRRLSAQCAFVAQDWDNLFEGLAKRQYDMVMAALEITSERRRAVDFSLPYVRAAAAFVVRADSPLKNTEAATLAGKKIGVEENTSAQAFAEARYKASDLKTYGGLVEAMLDLAEEKIDVVLADEAQVADFLKTRKEAQCCRLLAVSERDPAIFGEGMAAAFRKDDSLRAEFDRALTSMFDDGAFHAIARRYFSFTVR